MGEDFQPPHDGEDPHFKEIIEFLESKSFSEFSTMLPEDWKGSAGDLARTINKITKVRSDFSDELVRSFNQVREKGRLDAPMDLDLWPGRYKDIAHSLNEMVENAGKHVASIAKTLDNIADGILTDEVTTDSHGDMGALT